MRVAFAFILLVLGGTGVVMYQVGWRHPGSAPGTSEQSVAPLQAPEFETLDSSSPTPRRETAEPAATRLADAAPSEVWYQYTDERGSVRFASSLDQVPPQWRERAGRVEMSAKIQTVPTRKVARRPAARKSKPAQRAWWPGSGSASASDYSGEVLVYTTRWCGYCKKAISRLEELGVDYVELDIEDDSDVEAEFLEKSGGSRGVPLIDVDGQIMQGYSEGRLDEMLKLAS